MSFQLAAEDSWLSVVMLSVGRSAHRCGARTANNQDTATCGVPTECRSSKDMAVIEHGAQAGGTGTGQLDHVLDVG